MSAGDQAGAFGAAQLDVVADALSLAGGDHGADASGIVGRIADRETVHHGGQGVDVLGAAVVWHQDPGLGDTGLAAVHQRGDLDSGGDFRWVGVVEDHGGRLAAEFQAHPFQCGPACRGDFATRCGGAGEGHLVDIGVPHQISAGIAVAREDRHNSGRNISLSATSSAIR